MEEQDKLLSPNQLADRLNVATSWIYARTREKGPGSIPRIKLGKYLRFNFQDVMNWLKDQS